MRVQVSYCEALANEITSCLISQGLKWKIEIQFDV